MQANGAQQPQLSQPGTTFASYEVACKPAGRHESDPMLAIHRRNPSAALLFLTLIKTSQSAALWHATYSLWVAALHLKTARWRPQRERPKWRRRISQAPAEALGKEIEPPLTAAPLPAGLHPRATADLVAPCTSTRRACPNPVGFSSGCSSGGCSANFEVAF